MTHVLSRAALASLELLVAQGSNSVVYGEEVTEWQTFCALLDRAGFETSPNGIRLKQAAAPKQAEGVSYYVANSDTGIIVSDGHKTRAEAVKTKREIDARWGGPDVLRVYETEQAAPKQDGEDEPTAKGTGS